MLRKLPYRLVGSLSASGLFLQRSYCSNTSADANDPLGCKKASCHEKIEMFNIMKDALKNQKVGEKGIDSHAEVVKKKKSLNCPIDKKELGASTWNLLHTMAAHYPEHPTSIQKEQMKNFILALAEFYPCDICRDDFKHNVEISPPKVESRKDLVIWLCEQHNLVNEKLGMETFPCNEQELDKRWLKGEPGCWNYDLHK